ncbi:outer membrane protein assembly factor BamB family protein [Haloarchaeobius iranensis]|uniref:Outer membrane protein assembly factor BamB, contains PQQ-like beta-propeller repeat n=1 Tax=Haloarchaeobius iranensis TaxID=996166 RepID=A0A1G9ZI28_9EURY|nr:PQQ-binding-like beta-propeller repeat protein [Haloarchaeobius iranensis]SDN20173.1 Outer membrane protein assembly factor BamB, contains PQQ-like beta-propeller repeat [Haloarchaeobius iranensis]
MKRRQVLAAIGVSTLSGCAALTQGTSNKNSPTTLRDKPGECANSPQWESLQGNPQRTGTYTETSPAFTETTSEVVFGRTVEGTTPVVGEYHIYVTGTDGLYALSRDSKSTVWSKTISDFQSLSPLVVCDLVVFQTGNQISAFDTDDGTLRWDRDFVTGLGEASPLATSDAIYAAEQSSVSSLTFSGERNWEALNGDHAIHGIAASDDRLFVTASVPDDGGGAVHALTLDDGEHEWRTEGIESHGEPVVGPDAVYVLERDGPVHALDRGSGERRWQVDVESSANEAPPTLDIASNTLFTPTNSEVIAIDTESRDVQWRTDVGGSDSGIAKCGDRLYVPGRNVTELDATTGEVLWESTEYAGTGPAAVTSNALWVNAGQELVTFAP